MADVTLEALSDEDRTFPPSPDFVAGALVTDDTMRREADADPEAFWAAQARALLDWDADFTTTCEWDLPFAKWFTGGRLNVSYNCLDRHVAAGHGDQVAILWEGEPGDARSISYGELLAEVGRTANALKELGVERGDRVAIYMGMVPELADRDARVRPDRRGALGRLRRLHRRLAARPHQRRRGTRARHGRRCVAARGHRPAQGDRRRRARRDPVDREVPRAPPDGAGRRDDRRPRRLVARHRPRAVTRLRARVDGRRGPAVHPLHQRDHREAQGHHAHHRRLPDAGRVHDEVRVRPPPRHRRVLVHRRLRVGHRPLLHRLRPAREPRRRASCTRARPITRARTGSGRSSRSTGCRSSTRHRPRSAPS